MKNVLRTWVAICSLTAIIGCGSSEEKSCLKGETKICHCAGGTTGVQTCADDGKSWGGCTGCTSGIDSGPDAGLDGPVTPVDGPAPDSFACKSGQTLCGKTCTNLLQDVANCGKCDNACTAGQVCSAGSCAVSCQQGLVNCNGTCVNLKTDPKNCGACTSTCKTGQQCLSGTCTLSCQTGLTNCSGTCVNLKTNLSNCGVCGTTCKAGEVCSSGACAVSCQQGMSNCSGTCVNLKTDLSNCGACGSTCKAGESCSAGGCMLSCQSGLTNCAGTCVDLKVSLSNCGYCGTKCTAGQICAAGACTLSCQSGLTDCSGTCVNQQTDPYNCGKCGNACKAGMLCSAGACALTCLSGLTNCSGSCVNLQTDSDNCASCGAACKIGQYCTVGACAAACGNVKIDPGEQCDATLLGGSTCKSLGYYGGTLACSKCAFDVSSCYKCGDGVINGSEQCDGKQLGSKTCKSLSFDGGTLTCSSTCTLDTSACHRCTDKTKGGDETDVDCGGKTCSPCALGKACKVSSDCKEGSCSAGKCYYPSSCKDLLKAQPTTKDGVYTIDPDGSGPLAKVSVRCDMTRDGGGWTFGVKAWYQCGVHGKTGAVGSVSNALTTKGSTYKLSDAVIRAIIGAKNNFDVLADQAGYNSGHGQGNYEYVIIRNYTGSWKFNAKVSASSTTTVFQSYRLSDSKLAWTGNLKCGVGGYGINCLDVIKTNPAGGAGCLVKLSSQTNSGWHHWYMGETNTDTYLYICNGAQHSSSHNMNHRYWFRAK